MVDAGRLCVPRRAEEKWSGVMCEINVLWCGGSRRQRVLLSIVALVPVAVLVVPAGSVCITREQVQLRVWPRP